VTKSRADSYRDLVKGLSEESDIQGRALELADTVSDMIWGGKRGWEIATDSQYQSLLRTLRDRLRTHPEA
jgi:hypothetical protein